MTAVVPGAVPDLEVQVRAVRAAGVADLRDLLPGGDVVALARPAGCPGAGA